MYLEELHLQTPDFDCQLVRELSFKLSSPLFFPPLLSFFFLHSAFLPASQVKLLFLPTVLVSTFWWEGWPSRTMVPMDTSWTPWTHSWLSCIWNIVHTFLTPSLCHGVKILSRCDHTAASTSSMCDWGLWLSVSLQQHSGHQQGDRGSGWVPPQH